MSFPNIKTDEPKGSDRVSTIDDRERETRSWLVQSLEEISGYPDCPFVKIGTWSSETRPINPAANVFGYNTTTKRLEYYTGSTWEALQVDATNINVDSATHAESADYATKATYDGSNNEISSTYLKLVGGTITGGLTVNTSSPTVDGKTTALTRGTNPDSNIARSVFNIKDNSGNALSGMSKDVSTAGTSWTKIVDYDHQDGTQHYLGVGHTATGAVQTYAPTPASSSNDTSIATTAFVKDIFDQTKDYIIEKRIEANGYIKFNSGLIIQWGSVAGKTRQSDESSSRSINLPKALSSAVYYSNAGYSITGIGNFSNRIPYNLTCSTSKITQALINSDDDGNQRYPLYFPAFKYFVVGK